MPDTPAKSKNPVAFSRWTLQGIADGKVTYDVEANSKLVIENQRERYHCPAKYKDYARIQLDTDDHDPERQEGPATRNDEAYEKWKSLGLGMSMVRSGSDINGAWWQTNRAPFRAPRAWKTMDGRPVAS